MILVPRSLEGNTTHIDSAMFKPEFTEPIKEVYYGYIKDSTGIIAKAPIEDYTNHVFLHTIGKAKVIALDFDIELKKSKNVYDFKTLEEPHIVWIDENDIAWYTIGFENEKIKISENVACIDICRGWKNVLDKEIDQGFLISYIKNGIAYYKPIINGEFKSEACFDTIEEVATHISSYRTIDYRVVFVINTIDKTYVFESERCWAGVAIPEETLNNFIITSSCSYNYQPIMKLKYETGIETLNKFIITNNTNLVFGSSDIFASNTIYAHNEDGFGIYVYLDESVYTTLTKEQINQAISITDERQIRYAIESYEYRGRYLYLKTSNFNNSKGNIKVNVNGTLLNIAGIPVTEKFCTFAPINLVPFPTNPPNIVSIGKTTEFEHNEDYIVIEFDTDLSGSIDKAYLDIKLIFEKPITTNNVEKESKKILAISSEIYNNDRKKLLVKFNHNDEIRGEVDKFKFEYICLNSIIYGKTEQDIIESIEYEYSIDNIPYFNDIGCYETISKFKIYNNASINFANVNKKEYNSNSEILFNFILLSQGGLKYEQVGQIKP